jgi:DNA-binding HxlR family transcriptional regulator
MKAAAKKSTPATTTEPPVRPAPGGAAPDIAGMVESIVGCKWSVHVLEQVRRGVNRPGALVRTTEGLTTKVLNERLAKMLRFGILHKVSYPEIPPRVEYHLTPLGERFTAILDEVERLKGDVARGDVPDR